MLKTLALLAICLLLPFGVKAEDIKIGSKNHLWSETLKEDREYWVSLPASYNHNNYTQYPVLYLLDADINSLFQTFSGMVNQMSVDASPTIPEMIVVGIVNKNRVRDSSPTNSLIQYGGSPNSALSVTGGANHFINFIKDELIPHIDTHYRTSNYRVISGYSFTGLVVIQSLYSTPETFNAYIAIDPSMWWDNQHMLKQLKTFRKTPQLHKRRLFIASSERVSEVYPKENYVIQFINELTATPKPGLHFDSVIFGLEENHHSMPVIGFYKGLRSIFNGYMIDDHARFRSASSLQQHFDQISEKLGSQFVLRENLLNWFGYERLYNDQFGIDIDHAIAFFQLNTQYYPSSAQAWQSLGEAYMQNGQWQQAQESLKKSLELDPNNDNTKEKMKKVLAKAQTK